MFVRAQLSASLLPNNLTGNGTGLGLSISQQIVDQHAIGRICQPEDIANVVIWLCSDASSYLLGSCVVADGGFSLV